jgi:hypothetical protein
MAQLKPLQEMFKNKIKYFYYERPGSCWDAFFMDPILVQIVKVCTITFLLLMILFEWCGWFWGKVA